MRQLLLFSFFVGLLSCTEENTPKETVYFAGEIVNPTSDYVVLYKNDAVVDSAQLNEHNRFSFTLNNVDEGLHHFKHAPQLQYVFLEKGDSLLIRLNASPAYFDESLVFSGDNDVVNNFMIEMFLTHEDEEHLVYSYFTLPPEDFSRKMDSLQSQKLEELELLLNNEEISENGYALARASVDYTSFLYMEKYPFYHKKKTGEDTFHQLGADFYGYREQLNLNDKRLSYFKPYYDFMKHHFGNLSYMACLKDCGKEEFHSAAGQLHLNKHKMVMIDSLVTEEHLRDNLLRNVAMDFLLKVHMANDECDKFVQDFESFSNNEAHVEEIKYLFKGIKSLQPNKALPHLVLEDSQGNTTTLKEISRDGNTVFYFWTADQKRHFKNVSKQVKKLKKLHPEHRFVGINLSTAKPEWNAILQATDFDLRNQYRGENFETVQNTLIVDHLNKCVVTKDTLIVNAFGNLYASFEPKKKP
ncbi:MAG: transaldolase [Bacteroidota bacterium]